MTSLASCNGPSRSAGRRIRPFTQADVTAYDALLAALSPADVRLRFHAASIPSPVQVGEMLFGPAALGGVLAEAPGGDLLGVAHAARERSERRGEFGILVAAPYRRNGVGGALTDALLWHIAARGTTEVVAYTAWENNAAAALLRSRGFAGRHDGGGTMRWVLAISGARAS